MTRLPQLVGPAWPPALSAYDHMSAYAKPDWAWEGLRRNPRYQEDAGTQPPVGVELTRTTNGVPVTRLLTSGLPTTLEWAVCPFR